MKKITEHPLNTKAKREKSIEEIERRVEAVKLVSGSLALQELIRDIVDVFYDDRRNVEWWIAEELHKGFCVYNGESVEETSDRLYDEAILDKEEYTDTPFKHWIRTVQPKKNEETPETRYLRSLGATSV